MIATLFEQYAAVEDQLKTIVIQKEMLRKAILTTMMVKKQETTETNVGKFTITKLKTWEYPEQVKAIGENFKAAKAQAESTGEATFEETPSLRFTGLKI